MLSDLLFTQTLALLSSTLAYQASIDGIKKKPTVFYCTRTHSQLQQIVKEFRNCHPSYTQKPDMCVLGSRQHLCLNNAAKQESAQGTALDEVCTDHRSMGMCPFMEHPKQAEQTANALKQMGIWDIEDAVAAGKEHNGCSYYATKNRFADATNVLCPYNYILDPGIRGAMKISLKDAIVIFDEAHNIEDVARDAASIDLLQPQLTTAMIELKKMIKRNAEYQYCGKLIDFIEYLQNWIEEMAEPLFVKGPGFESEAATKSFTPANRGTSMRSALGNQKPSGGAFNNQMDTEESECVWDGEEFLHIFHTRYLLSVETLAIYLGIMQQLNEAQDKAKEDVKNRKEARNRKEAKKRGNGGNRDEVEEEEQPSSQMISVGTMGLLRGYLNILDFMMRNNQAHANDFRIVIQKQEDDFKQTMSKRRKSSSNTTEMSARQLRPVKFHIWCMSASVIFEDIVASTHSIILTSGTLSPLDAFSAELGVAFPIKLEASHVINLSKQLFAGCFSTFNGHTLNSTYAYQQSDSYLDLIGQTMLMMMKLTPGGVLMFVPSYKLLQRLCDRWQANGLEAEVNNSLRSKIFYEQKNNTDMNFLLQDYYQELSTVDSKAGMVAVCRGKVSEGINFSDHFARAVIIVGIPFPALFDLQVRLKKKYQDRRCLEYSKNAQSAQSQPPNTTQQPNYSQFSTAEAQTPFSTPFKVPPAGAAGVQTPGSAAAAVPLVFCNDGNMWYKQQAFRAINQAIGRCIRHRADFGAIVLLDPRFHQDNVVQHLSRWMRQDTRYIERLEDSILGIHQFFQQHDSYATIRGLPKIVKIEKDLDDEKEETAAAGRAKKSKKADKKEEQDAVREKPTMSIAQAFSRVTNARQRTRDQERTPSPLPDGVQEAVDEDEQHTMDEPSIDMLLRLQLASETRAQLLKRLSKLWQDMKTVALSMDTGCADHWGQYVPARLSRIKQLFTVGATVSIDGIDCAQQVQTGGIRVHQGDGEDTDEVLVLESNSDEQFPWIDGKCSKTTKRLFAEAQGNNDVVICEEWSSADRVAYQLAFLLCQQSPQASPFSSPLNALQAQKYQLLGAKVIACSPSAEGMLHLTYANFSLLAEGKVVYSLG